MKPNLRYNVGKPTEQDVTLGKECWEKSMNNKVMSNSSVGMGKGEHMQGFGMDSEHD